MPRAKSSDVIAACKAANAHEFIQKLPKGYDEVLLESGSNLSGGETKIMLARAFLLCTDIIILDKPSSVDLNQN